MNSNQTIVSFFTRVSLKIGSKVIHCSKCSKSTKSVTRKIDSKRMDIVPREFSLSVQWSPTFVPSCFYRNGKVTHNKVSFLFVNVSIVVSSLYWTFCPYSMHSSCTRCTLPFKPIFFLLLPFYFFRFFNQTVTISTVGRAPYVESFWLAPSDFLLYGTFILPLPPALRHFAPPHIWHKRKETCGSLCVPKLTSSIGRSLKVYWWLHYGLRSTLLYISGLALKME